MKLTTSLKIYIGLVLILAVLMAVSVFMPAYQGMVPAGELPASKPVLALANFGIGLIIYGGLGLIGLTLAPRVGFAEIWEPGVSNRQRFLIPALVGAGSGILMIIADAIFSRLHSFGPLPHPQFPVSILASMTAGIGEELLFRLFFIVTWMWIISRLILKGRWQNQLFWIIATFSALAFAFGHIPTVMILYDLKTFGEIPPALTVEIILLNGVISMFAAYYFRKYGFLAAVGIHFWADVVWHVIWGLF